MGTPEFAVPSLDALVKNNYDVCAVFTKPDKPQGRKQIILPTPVKAYAFSKGIEVFQPEKLKSEESFELLKKINPDIIIVVAYGKILPKNFIDFPKYGCINVHGSLLPKYRGAAPIQWSIINGDTVTGITTMFMNEGLDTGDILMQEKIFINDEDTSEELKEKMSFLGAETLIKTIKNLSEITPKKQDDSQATLSPQLDKITGEINWEKTAKEIHNLVRGSNPWPIANTRLRGKLFKIYKTKISNSRPCYPGKVLSVSPLVIGCGKDTCLELLEVQIEGKKRMPASDFARGYRLSEKTVLGSSLELNS